MITVEEKHVDQITEVIFLILSGKKLPAKLTLPDDYPDNELKQVTEYVNKLIEEYSMFSDLMSSIATGQLTQPNTQSKMQVISSYKGLCSNLKHLTWKTQKIAGGDFNQKVDFMGDFSEAFNSMSLQLKDAFDKLEAQNKELKDRNEIISREKKKSEKLLLNILPVKVVDDLKQHGKSDPQTFENVTVYFSDLAGFTKISSTLDPKTLINDLSEMFTVFDNIMETNNCERIKTIGDAYLAVCGMPATDLDHARNILNAALGIQDYLLHGQKTSTEWQCRIGIHSGKVVGGVVGIKKYIYDVFGDTINTAARMETNGEVMKINVSETTYQLLKGEYEFTEREAVEVKGKGRMKMYFADGHASGRQVQHTRRNSPRFPVNTAIELMIGDAGISCLVEDMSLTGGVLLRVEKASELLLSEVLEGRETTVCVGSGEDVSQHQGSVVRNYEENHVHYIAVKF